MAEQWRDADGTDLWELTWRSAKKMSSNLTPSDLMARGGGGGGGGGGHA